MRIRREDISPSPVFKAIWPNSIQISSSVWYKVPLSVAPIDNKGGFNPGSNRYVIQESGIYSVAGRIYSQFYLNPSTWTLNAAIYKNGAIAAMGDQKGGYPGGGGTSWVFSSQVTDLLPLNKGDYLELYTLTYNVSTIIIGSTDPAYACFLSAHKVG